MNKAMDERYDANKNLPDSPVVSFVIPLSAAGPETGRSEEKEKRYS
jgi:hypothetical protein